MDYRLFISTFLLIFVAELGDKTQLAAMARTAESGGAKWVVFAAASAALVLSTLVAVLFGGVLTRFVSERTIKITAAVLFIAIGLLILRGALAKPATAAKPQPVGAMSRVILGLAARFEEAASLDYRALATAVSAPAQRNAFLRLAEEEDRHLQDLRTAAAKTEDVQIEGVHETELAGRPDLTHDVSAGTEPVLEHAIHHEEAMSGFYGELASLTLVPALRQIFLQLAAEEREHAERLRELQVG